MTQGLWGKTQALGWGKEEAFWKQRAKQHWLVGADQNMKFFHRHASHRKKNNTILRLKDGTGNWVKGASLNPLVLQYYVDIFTSSDSIEVFQVDSMQPRVSQEGDVTDFTLKCLIDVSFPEGLNDANIVLIPKKLVPELVFDLRPKALCNVIYKIIVKMSAFLHGKLITDDILITSKIGHFLRRKQIGNVGWAALKQDIGKAYDRINGMGFSEKYAA
ncbi:PREDICTED: uncharacterized protein LOC109158514 [Ipomoea nil]|uniref:uncharacterized protein LOC109158514 n=1 Tax=Ipomoea nil TaxID=35883 RepID=UPI000901E75F|nr:PREDICTED: uncharacterized protein LOC109158514 [Ipomoea nil]